MTIYVYAELGDGALGSPQQMQLMGEKSNFVFGSTSSTGPGICVLH